jgi:hypothetical protein
MDEDRIAGLCASCQNVRRITSDRGSRFYLCELSKTDPRFPKYPRLPVLSCSGYVSIQANQ